MREILEIAKNAKQASLKLGVLTTGQKNAALMEIADALEANVSYIISENEKDIAAAKANGMSSALIDRLKLDTSRIQGMAKGVREVCALEDPIGETICGFTRPNGLDIIKKRVPLGVIGIIYEARPNVTSDAISLCIKTGNAVILKGGKEAIHSNSAIMDISKDAAKNAGLPDGAMELIRDTSREATQYLMKLNGFVDILIPRGGAGLINAVVQNATVPVIQTGVGNCHIYIDESADLDMAKRIVVNAKTQRPAVCNAAESLLVHRATADKFIPQIFDEFNRLGVELRGDAEVLKYCDAKPAVEEDYSTEYLDLIMSAKIVDSIDEAIEHINRYGTKHSECIVTRNYDSAKKFQAMVDAAAVYVNASTRFTDGGEFGFGAEIGISTQKLHARGPMGLKELTTYKYLINGSGQIR
jgi:gamma-glutamyl phosphate reductase